MKTIVVDPGACQLVCHIKVRKTGRYTVEVDLNSPCKLVSKLADQMDTLDFLQIMKGSFGQNPVSAAAGRCKLHASCPIPCAILKAVEAELEMAVAKDVMYTFDASAPSLDMAQSSGSWAEAPGPDESPSA